MSSAKVFVPVEDLWNWFDVGAYLEALRQARTELMKRVVMESAWFSHTAGETPGIGLFQQQTGHSWR